MFHAGIHLCRSTNCMTWVDLSNPVKSGREMMKAAKLAESARILISPSWALGITRRRAAPAKGRNISVLSTGNPKLFVITCSIIFLPQKHPGSYYKYARCHNRCVVVKKSGLYLPQLTAKTADSSGNPVDYRLYDLCVRNPDQDVLCYPYRGPNEHKTI